MSVFRNIFLFVALCLSMAVTPARAEPLVPFILGNTPAGDMNTVATAVKTALTAQGFEVVGGYAPYPQAIVIVATHADLKAAALKAKNGGFGVAQRVAVTDVKGKLQVSYVNPAYLGTAYGLGRLETIGAKLKAALGAVKEFGAGGLEPEDLAPGKYHYAIGMPYFHNIDVLAKHADFQTAVDTVEKNLAAGKGGTKKVYRVDLAKETSVFGVGIVTGDGLDSGDKDTDKEVMDIVDFQNERSTAYLPYELMVEGGRIIALRGRYRIAVHFPDTSMMGERGFTKIMSAPGGIKRALTLVAGGVTE